MNNLITTIPFPPFFWSWYLILNVFRNENNPITLQRFSISPNPMHQRTREYFSDTKCQGKMYYCANCIGIYSEQSLAASSQLAALETDALLLSAVVLHPIPPPLHGRVPRVVRPRRAAAEATPRSPPCFLCLSWHSWWAGCQLQAASLFAILPLASSLSLL